MTDIRLPNITATTERGQLEQLRSYLYQFAQQLNWALGSIDRKAEEARQQLEAAAKPKDALERAQATFSEVKSLIIKSADIVNAYYEKISQRLEGRYVAVSDFGAYQQETAATLSASSEALEALFENNQLLQRKLEAVDGDVGKLHGAIQTDGEGTTVLGSQAWVKIGVLSYEDSGFPIYGMEIGQVDTEGGETVYKRFAQYRSDGVHLCDQSGIEVATVSDYTLKITNAEMVNASVTGDMSVGGYHISTANGLAFKWKGGGRP